MKSITSALTVLMITCLLFLAVKPLLPADKPVLQSSHYTTTHSECSSRSTLVSPCQSPGYYALTEENTLPVALYWLIVSRLLVFILVHRITDSPVSRLFRPPQLFQ